MASLVPSSCTPPFLCARLLCSTLIALRVNKPSHLATKESMARVNWALSYQLPAWYFAPNLRSPRLPPTPCSVLSIGHYPSLMPARCLPVPGSIYLECVWVGCVDDLAPRWQICAVRSPLTMPGKVTGTAETLIQHDEGLHFALDIPFTASSSRTPLHPTFSIPSCAED